MEMTPDFLLVPYQLIKDARIEPNDRLVYAVVYWFEHLRDGRCIASNMTIANILGITTRGVQNSLTNLELNGYIERTYKDAAKRNRAQILTKISFKAVRTDGDRQKTNEVVVIGERSGGDRANEVVVTRERRIQKRSKEVIPTEGGGGEVSEFIFLFKEINPSIGVIYGRPPQRVAAERLLKLHPMVWWKEFMTKYFNRLGQDKFCPRAITPVQMEAKLGSIIVYAHQLKTSSKVFNVV